MKLRTCLLTVLATASLSGSADASAILVIDSNGILRGATGVSVNGFGLYDVEFVEGTCEAIFDGCDAASDFDFTTRSGAEEAGFALIEQVFLNTSEGDFDSDSSLTYGCASDQCIVIIPYALFADPAGLSYGYGRNQDPPFVDTWGSLTDFGPPDSATSSIEVFSRWTPSAAAPVPEPASLILLGTGLAGLGARRWRQRKQ